MADADHQSRKPRKANQPANAAKRKPVTTCWVLESASNTPASPKAMATHTRGRRIAADRQRRGKEQKYHGGSVHVKRIQVGDIGDVREDQEDERWYAEAVAGRGIMQYPEQDEQACQHDTQVQPAGSVMSIEVRPRNPANCLRIRTNSVSEDARRLSQKQRGSMK